MGVCYSIFGFVAIAAYVFGGFLADKVQPKNLIGTALILTSLGGFYLCTLPGFGGICFLYGYWGFTSIFLLWAAMIKATRIWGGNRSQGLAFGLLDGGRGLVGALISTLAVAILIQSLGKSIADATPIEKGEAFKNVLIMSSSFVAFVGILIFALFKKIESGSSVAVGLKEMLATFKFPQVYLLAGIVFCAYSGYRLTDLIPQFAHEIGGMDEVFTSEISTVMLYGRAAVGFGLAFLADRTNHFNLLKIGFVFIALSCILYLLLGATVSSLIIFILPTTMIALGVYAGRVLYFSVIAKSRIPVAITGSAVGLISVIGYTPDIYFGIVSGYFLDNYGYEDGFKANFIMVFCLALIGLFFVFRLKKIAKNE